MKILFHEHLFDENPKEYEVEGSTWGEIIAKLGIKGHLAIFDNGETLLYPECHDIKPIMDTVRIMRKPEDKTVSYIIGGVLTVAGAVLTLTGFGAAIGVPLMVGGLAMIVGTMLIPPVPETKPVEDYAGGYNINGSGNVNAIGKVPPLVLGEYMVKPPIVGTQISQIEGSGINAKQRVKFLYCLGYRGEGSLVKNIKIGDTLVATNDEEIFNGQITVDGGIEANIEIRQDGTLPELYNVMHKEQQVGSEIKTFSEMEKTYYTTVAGCNSVTVSIIFQGLYSMADDGGLRNVSEAIRLYMRKAGSNDAWVQIGEDHTYTGNRNKQYTFSFEAQPTAQQVIDNPTKQWDVMICKAGLANDTNSRVNAKPYLGFIQFNTNREPVNADMKSKCIFLACEFVATQDLQSRIQEVSCIVKNKYKIWNGTDWNTVDYSSNPAAEYLYLLKSLYLPRMARDEQIDWATLQELYQWCEDNNRTCNWVISNPMQLRDLLNNILFTCQGSFYLKNGLYSVSFDKVQSSPVALLLPKNTSDFVGEKVFGNKIDALECTFVDKNADYKQTTEIIMPYGKTTFTHKQSVDMFGTDNYEQTVKIARYMLACNELRPETYKLRMGIEHFSIPRGSRVLVQHDVLKVGICGGRIKRIFEYEGDWHIEIDEVVDIGNEELEYCLTVFNEDGDMITVDVYAPQIGTNILDTYSEPVGVKVGDLYAYGVKGTETIDCIVEAKERDENMGCYLTLRGYAREIFDAVDKTVPEYNPKVYRGNTFYGGAALNPDEVQDLKDNLLVTHFGNVFFDFGTYAQKDAV